MIQVLKFGFVVAETLIKIVQVSAAVLIVFSPIIGIAFHLFVVVAPFFLKEQNTTSSI